jgi:hypothetical protein
MSSNNIYVANNYTVLINILNEWLNRIGCEMVSVLASSAVDRRFEPRSGQTKDYKIGICCFSTKHTSLRRKSKDWLARNQNNVSGWSDMFIRGLLFQSASIIIIQLKKCSSTKRTSSSSHWKLTWYSSKIAELALNNNHSLNHSMNDWQFLIILSSPSPCKKGFNYQIMPASKCLEIDQWKRI